MRTDPAAFTLLDRTSDKRPRFVVEIDFDGTPIYVTSHTDVFSYDDPVIYDEAGAPILTEDGSPLLAEDGNPGLHLAGALAEPSITSQRLNPDEARAEIGTASFSIVDVSSGFTNAVRAQLEDGIGLRNRRVRFWLGYAELPWSGYMLIGTQRVSSVLYERGSYTVECADIQREMRAQIFDLATTTLTQTVAATDTTIYVDTTTGFELLAHGSSYSDAPNTTVGYIQIGKEVIRYTGKTANTFTGCTRGVISTVPAEHVVDGATAQNRREKVVEYVYLELPAIKLLWALLTGQLYGSANVLPTRWHLGISPDLLELADFTGIGPDLWTPADDANGVTLRFTDIKKTDGKRFIETEILRLLGLYAPVYASGNLGLRRMTRVLYDAAPVATLNESNCAQVGAMTHDMGRMRNAYQVSWNWNGSDYTRPVLLLDATSRTIHGAAEPLELKFKGLFGGRHTDATVFKLIDSLRDRFAAPPLRLSVDVLHSLNRIEVGDVVRVKLASVRDYAGTLSSIDRAFEVQSVSVNHRTGAVSLDLFGTTAPSSALSPTVNTTALPNAYYTAQGAALSSLITITGGVMATGAHSLTGGVDATATGSVFYHDGDLTIPQDATVNITGNVQLRVRGSLTLNGVINGVGGGLAGVSDDSEVATRLAGNPGFVGNARGYDGLAVYDNFDSGNPVLETIPAVMTRGRNPAFPVVDLEISGNSLKGIPTDLRGTGGGPGGKLLSDNGTVFRRGGGTGGTGGAGLVIVCRGFALGVSGQINLSGTDGTVPAVWLNTSATAKYYSGTGAAGGPGALLVLLDGSAVSAPDLTGRFIASTGLSVIPPAETLIENTPRKRYKTDRPFAGYDSPDRISGQSLAASALRIQYVPAAETAAEDSAPVPPVTAATATGVPGAIDLAWTNPADASSFTSVEVLAATSNDRGQAVIVFSGLANRWAHITNGLEPRWYWFRARRGNVTSAFYPAATTSTITSAPTSLPIISGGFVPDPFFERSASIGEFWKTYDQTAGSATALGIAIAPSGGVGPGSMSFTYPPSVAADALFVVQQSTPIQFVTGEEVRVTLRWKRTGSVGPGCYISPYLALAAGVTDGWATNNEIIGSLATVQSGPNSTLASYAGIDSNTPDPLTESNFAFYAADQWHESRWVVSMGNLPKNQSQRPYLVMALRIVSNGDASAAGTIVVDSYQVRQI